MRRKARTAEAAYRQNADLIRFQVSELTSRTEVYRAEKPGADWGDVGSAAHLAEILAQALAVVTGRGDVDALPAKFRDAQAHTR